MKALKLTAIIFGVLFNHSAYAESGVHCSGVQATVDKTHTIVGGYIRKKIEFEISESDGYLLIAGANLPYFAFKITGRTEGSLSSETTDKDGYDWLIYFDRYSGKFNLFQSKKSSLTTFIPLTIEDAICLRRERIL